ncbi:hypothetical protein ACHAXS_004104 [Conticribra weissflogii]
MFFYSNAVVLITHEIWSIAAAAAWQKFLLNQYFDLYKIEIFSNLKKLRFELEIA